ncbi:TPA: hypothetical protein EYP66_11230 [Candidatus Poribacteria bacterium]|nr:hypothetical protein [Candidatus Poribacteria bacterium]
MPTIQLLKEAADNVWRELIELGPVHRIPPAEDNLYIVSRKQVKELRRKNLPFKEVNLRQKKL